MSFITEFKLNPNFQNPPKKLYYKGNLKLLDYPKVAIVGSRRCSSYTKNMTINLASTLKKYGVCVVSGAAIGVDICAHTGAYPHTIAVFGNGLDQIYPIQNSKIIKDIYENSLALSTYEPDITAKGWQFLERNLITVALSDAVVVAQADIQSGSMSSARAAIKFSIPLYVLPQRLGESSGTNELLQSGKAQIITDFDKFAMKFGVENYDNIGDEVVEFIKQNSNFDDCYAKFGDLIYEYELDGKIAIDGIYVRIL
ncbi:DNA-processing protein DprA [Campylobacter porcelli]|uniref:DNA-processing protein DprA n=2 Tax=Campylobacter TaxID=194 RepID=A0ABU7M2Z2_9BACT|nr:DNA-processing protein DprA [Campylobacter sp. CX2-4855-23]MEE3776039.1 DNA-processing protein DprA [Campylobacter sp. CX2-4080-23]